MNINEQIGVAGVVSLFLLCFLLRIGLTISYQAAIGLAGLQVKSLKVKSDVEKLSNGAFGRVAKEYVALAQAGAKVDALGLAKTSIYTNRLLFFNFNSLGRLIKDLETAFVPIAILVVIVISNQLEFALLFGGVFILLRIFGAIFDINTAKDRYITVLARILAKDVGKFFPQDTAGAVYTLGADLKEFLARQSAMYSDILIKINGEFVNSIKSNVATMTDSVEATLNAITRHDGVGEAASQIKALGVAAEAMAERMEFSGKHSEVLEQSLAQIRENQTVLGASVSAYEASLKDITAQMGDAMGKIVAYHMSAANTQIADSIGENLAQVKSANADQLAEVKEIFAQLTEQNRQTNRILTSLLKGGEDDD